MNSLKLVFYEILIHSINTYELLIHSINTYEI